MPVALYFDVHIPQAIADQLQRRGVTVLRAQDDSAAQLADDQLLERSMALGRPIFTFDPDFLVLADAWQRQSKAFAGVLFGPQEGVSIGRYVLDLEIIGKAGDPADFADRVEFLPL